MQSGRDEYFAVKHDCEAHAVDWRARALTLEASRIVENTRTIELRIFRNMLDALVKAYREAHWGCGLDAATARRRTEHVHECVQSVVEWWLAGGEEVLGEAFDEKPCSNSPKTSPAP